MEKVYKNIEHTGDLGVEVYGNSRENLLANASLALSDIIADTKKVESKREVEWSIEADSPEELLVKQLEEILYRLDSEGMIFKEFRISLRGLDAIKCLAFGEPLDREKHDFKTEIKAVTHHQLKIHEENGQWLARIIFDV